MRFLDQIPLKNGWRFSVTQENGVESPDFDDSGFATVTLPHDWQIGNVRDPDMEAGGSQGYYPRNQTGWYRLRFFADDAWRGQAVRLKLDGCYRFYSIYLNGARIGGHRYGYVPYLLDMSDALRYGEENLLCVCVNEEQTRGDRWYSGAGLCRMAWLLVDAPVHIAPFGVCARYTLENGGAKLSVSVDMENCTGAAIDATLSMRVVAPNGRVCAERTSEVALTRETLVCGETLTLENVRRWDIDDPALYRIEVDLQSGETIDRVDETVGFRSFSFDGETGFTLNGKNRKLYGANLHHDGGVCFGAVVPPAMLRRRLQSLRALGCNAIRCSHNPHDEALYALCDELGFVMIDELYDKWVRTNLYFEKLHDIDWRDDLRAMVLRDRNHPSIVLWSMGNELDVQYSDFFYERFAQMKAACLALDPTRPVTVALIGFCVGDYTDATPLRKKLDAALRYAEVVDVFCGNYMENFYTALREAGMRKPIIGTEVFSYYRHDELTTLGVLAASPWRDVDERPYVAGGFVWAGVDYLGESTGYPCKGWTGCPIDSTGVWKLRAWHLLAQWSKAPVLKIAVYDAENVPWDGANSMWSFPEMSGHWNYRHCDQMKHVAVMTNCDEVLLYLNDDPVRRSKNDAPDRLVHFYVRYRPGKLRAVGLVDGQIVVEQTLQTSTGAASIRLKADKPDDDGFAAVECWLLDDYGQLWTQSTPEVTFTLDGDATLLGVDNGDFMHDVNPHGGKCAFHNGHAVAYVRVNTQAVVRAACGHFNADLSVET